MFRNALMAATTVFSVTIACAGNTLAQTLPLNRHLIDFNSPEGEQLLFESEARRDFIPLSMQFTTQDNLAFCGVASMVITLNALGIEAPFAAEYRRNYFTQNNIFNEKTEQIISAEAVRWGGMTLEQLGGLLATYPVEVEVYHAEVVSLEEFRELARQNLQQPHNFILVNYLRRVISQESGGHISPLAAYHLESDRFLILDVSRYKYPPVWVKTKDLWQAMATIDPSAEQTRGFVAIAAQDQ